MDVLDYKNISSAPRYSASNENENLFRLKRNTKGNVKTQCKHCDTF